MQKKDFLYFLTDADGRSYHLDAYGKVVSSTQAIPLTNTPEGWMEKAINYVRNQNYYGVFRSFTVPLKFVTDGNVIVRYLFYKYGVQAECYLRIAKLNRSTDIHEAYFVGLLDFSTFQDDKEGFYVQVNILDNGLADKIKNKGGTTYEIPMGPDTEEPQVTEDPTVNVLLDGIVLKGSYSFTAGLDFYPQLLANFCPNIVTLNGEGFTDKIEAFNVQYTDESNDMSIFPKEESKLLSAKTDIPNMGISVSYKISFRKINYPTTPHFTLALFYGDNQREDIIHDVSFSSNDNEWKTIEGEKEFDISLNSGDIINIVSDFSHADFGDPSHYIQVQITEFKLKALFTSKAEPTYTKALRPSFLFDRLITKLSGQTGVSQLLQGNDENERYTVLVTVGDAIRRMEDAKIKTTFKDFFQAINVIFNAGLGIENNQAILEAKSRFYNSGKIIDLGPVSNLKVSPDKELLYNLIEVGYPAQTYDKVNGRDEFNNTSQFSTPITRVDNKLDLVSKYQADMYGIEFTRIYTLGKDTTDTSSDDTIYFLVVEPTPYIDPESGEDYYKLYRDPIITGVISPETAFNAMISPKHILLKHGNVIHGSMDKLDSEVLKFQTSDKKSDVTIMSETGTTKENSDELIAYLNPKLWLPYVFEFDTKLPLDTKKLFDNNPYGLITFEWEGVEYKGFVQECSIEPALRDSQTWKVLSAPNQDLSKL